MVALSVSAIQDAPHTLDSSSLWLLFSPPPPTFKSPARLNPQRVMHFGAPSTIMEALSKVLSARQAPDTNANDDQNIGSSQGTSPSLSGLISTLVPTLIIAVVCRSFSPLNNCVVLDMLLVVGPSSLVHANGSRRLRSLLGPAHKVPSSVCAENLPGCFASARAYSCTS